MSSDPALFYAAMFFGGLGGYWYGLNQYFLRKIIQYTPTAKAVAVAPGIVEVCGLAKPYKGYLTAPFEQTECLFYVTELYKWSGSGKSRHSKLITHLESADPIYLEDDTGLILIQPTLKPVGSCSSMQLVEDRTEKKQLGAGIFKAGIDKSDPLYRFVSRVAPEYKEYNDDLEVHETFIRDGDQLFVLGTAAAFEDGKSFQMIIKDDPSRKFFCISDGSEKNALSQISTLSGLCLLCGPGAAFLGYLLLLDRFDALSDSAFLVGTALFLLLYAWVAATILVGIYNGLIQLKNNIKRARANIDALLKMRATLIPELIEAVKGYASYEKEVLEIVATLRASQVGNAGKNLLALKERLPDLKANQQFLGLQKELTTLEDRVAASRTFLSESVALYNQQIRSIPSSLIAALAGLRAEPFPEFSS
jgi:LemA protein